MKTSKKESAPERQHYFIPCQDRAGERRQFRIVMPLPPGKSQFIEGLERMEAFARPAVLDIRAMARGAPRASTES